MATAEDERVTSEAFAGADEPARIPLGQLLIQAGFLSQAQVDDALFEGSRTGERLGEVVVRRGIVTEDDVARLLAEQWGLDYVERSAIWFDADALARLSREDAQRLEAMPTRIEGGRVVVAVAEPTEQRLAALREVIGEETVMIVVPKSALDAGLRSDLLRSGTGDESSEVASAEAPPAPEPDVQVELGEELQFDETEQEGLEDAVELEPVVLAPVTPLPVERPVVDASDPAATLADEAQAVADRLLAQAAAVRAQQQAMQEKTAQYEGRIEELERALEERTRQLADLRRRLEDVLSAFDA